MAACLIMMACCRSVTPLVRCPARTLEYSTGTYVGLLLPLVFTQGILQHIGEHPEGICVGS